ncbi:MAG: LOG family protein, partial [Alphaproteobacteria bacterium]|nr:LOG family protein [Alphaproteobacteria bacterium]
IEMLTWAQLGRHDKPVVIVDINGFWRHLQALLDHMRDEEFLHSLAQLRPVFVDSAEAVLPALAAS